ncbi:MAG TPA: SOS response-associated peptidase [Daejeonella sp.]
MIYSTMVERGYKVFDYRHYYHADGFERPLLAITTNQEPNVVQLAQWKLLPDTVRNEAEAKRYANTFLARAEDIFTKPSFAPYVHQRCLLWVNGFYESHHPRPKVNVPFFIHMPDMRPFSLGGIWTDWRNMDTGEIIKTFAVITTPANQLLSQIHNIGQRMPLIIHRNARRQWMQGNLADMKSLMVPYFDGELEAYPVSNLIHKRNVVKDIPEAQQRIAV